jgi:hypothetical protein
MRTSCSVLQLPLEPAKKCPLQQATPHMCRADGMSLATVVRERLQQGVHSSGQLGWAANVVVEFTTPSEADLSQPAVVACPMKPAIVVLSLQGGGIQAMHCTGHTRQRCNSRWWYADSAIRRPCRPCSTTMSL